MVINQQRAEILMPYTAPTSEQARAFRRSYHRRQLGFIALNIASGLFLLAAIAIGSDLAKRPGGMPAWAVGIGIGVVMTVFVASTLTWRCPRCSVPFGRRFSVDECPECHLRFDGAG